MKPINRLVIIFIIILAVFLRSYKLASLPSLNPDEAALGYNAYSLLLTGRDEHGAAWPLHFKSFGDYKPGGYVYLALPFIRALGLTPLAVRLPNLILSVLTVYFLYRLVLLLTSNFRLASLSAFVLAVNPWHIHFSRGAWESSTALFFIILGIYWFYIFLKQHKNIFLPLSFLSLVISMYFYHSARIVAPILGFSLFVLYYREITSRIRPLIFSLLLAIVFTLPVLLSFIHNGGAARFGGVGLSADSGPLNRAEELLNQHGNTALINRIIHNRRILYFLSWGQKYLSHFDGNFLFISGDEVPRSRSPDMGQFYLFEVVFLIFGIVSLFKSKYLKSRESVFIILFLLIAPLASSLTFQAPSALRSLPLVIPLSLAAAFGLNWFLDSTKKFRPHNAFLVTVFYLYSLFYFYDAYFIHAPKRYPFAWNTGFADIMPFIDRQKPKFQNIYFTDTYDQPYILYLFFNRYPPAKLQPQIKLTPPDKFGFSTVAQIDNIHFGPINYGQIPPGSLVIAGAEKIPVLPEAVYYFPNNTIGFKIYEK